MQKSSPAVPPYDSKSLNNGPAMIRYCCLVSLSLVPASSECHIQQYITDHQKTQYDHYTGPAASGRIRKHPFTYCFMSYFHDRQKGSGIKAVSLYENHCFPRPAGSLSDPVPADFYINPLFMELSAQKGDLRPPVPAFFPKCSVCAIKKMPDHGHL